jgi:predicted nucleic acid-binding protein
VSSPDFIGDPVAYWSERVDHAEQYLEFVEQMLHDALLARDALHHAITRRAQ